MPMPDFAPARERMVKAQVAGRGVRDTHVLMAMREVPREAFVPEGLEDFAACLVADMRMRGLTGLELHQELVTSGRGIPTVIITAHPEELTQARARDAGICCYLIKPFAPDELLECVREALARSHARLTIPKS